MPVRGAKEKTTWSGALNGRARKSMRSSNVSTVNTISIYLSGYIGEKGQAGSDRNPEKIPPAGCVPERGLNLT